MPEKPQLSNPPRAVPRSLRLRVAFGGVLPLIGWLMLAIGGFMATVFVGNSELVTWYEFSGETATAPGTVTASERTNATVNQQRVYRIVFEYSAEGRDLRGSSYYEGTIPEGTVYDVEYVVANPEVARIANMRTRPFSGAVALILLFPFVGLILVMAGRSNNKKRLWLMSEGESAWGLLTDREPTNTRINNQRVYALTFTYVDEQGEQRTMTARSHHHRFFDEDKARHVLYDEASHDACLVDLIPGRPRIANGEWQAVPGAKLIPVLLPPIFALLMLTIASQIKL